MPPSPQAEQGVEKLPSLRRASSLPPENIRLSPRPSTPISVIKRLRLLRIPDNDDAMDRQDHQEDEEGTVEIEELSPEAIIPDSLPIIRDPEIETPQEEGGDDCEEDTDVASTNAAERMSDATVSDQGTEDDSGDAMDERDGYATPEKRRPVRKRKYSDGDGKEQRRRKRTFKAWMSSPG